MRKNIVIVLIALFIGISFIKYGMNSSSRTIFTENAPKPIGPYSQAVEKDNLLFVSGQIAIDPVTNQIDTSGIENETKRVMENICAILKAANSDQSHILKTTIYLTDLNNFKKVNEIYAGYFKSEPPARETVQVCALPKGVNIEISVVAGR